MRRWLSAFVCAVSAWFLVPAHAQPEHCRLALLLALDVSSSVDAEEYILQRDGLAAALSDPVIRTAILDGNGHVSLAIYEWSGRRQSAMVSNWTALTDNAAIDSVIENLMSAPRSHTRFPTAMGYALGYGAGVLARGPVCLQQTLDMAGDGQNNEGFPPEVAYRSFPFDGVTVNGLVVAGADFEGETNLIPYFREEVIRGPGAFVEVATGYSNYEAAMRRKLLRELSAIAIGALAPDGEGPG